MPSLPAANEFISTVWTPSTPLDQPRFQQLSNNDAFIRQYTQKKINYGYYDDTWDADVDITFDVIGGANIIPGGKSKPENNKYVVNCHAVNEMWKFGVNFRHIRVICDAAYPLDSRADNTGYQNCGISIYATSPSGVKRRIINAASNGPYSTYPFNGAIGANGVYTDYNRTAFDIDAVFMYTFDEIGPHYIEYWLDAYASDAVSASIHNTKRGLQSQVYAKCMGAVTSVISYP